MNVKKIVVKAGHRPLATLDEKGWTDPYGGTFAPEEIANLDRVLWGDTNDVIIGRGTPYEVTHTVRMRVMMGEAMADRFAFVRERARKLALCLMNYTEVVTLDERAELCEAAIFEILRVIEGEGSGS